MHNRPMRGVLLWGVVLWGMLVGRDVLAATPIQSLLLDLHNLHKWDDSNGDTWDPFWADDDSLYAFNDDGRGFGSQQRNLAFNQLRGDGPHRLQGRIVNSMDEYGGVAQKGADGATWKACGQECIDSVFYAFVSRHAYGCDSHDPLMRQTAVNASLIKSTDKGRTWTRSAAENYQHPMWPGGRFGAPYFIHYGKNGGQTAQDAANQYVYAISPNGFWNCSDDYILARVPRAKLADLRASDWTYYAGGNGLDATGWLPQIDRAKPILSVPKLCSMTPACHIPSLGVYLMVVWGNTPAKLTKWFEPEAERFDFYQAEHPWGPWTRIQSTTDRFLVGGHMYGPTLCPKFQQRSGGEVKMSLFTSGCPFDDVPGGIYKLWEIPLILRTRPLPAATLVNDDDAKIVYRGSWTSSGHRGFSDYRDDVHSTTAANDSAEFTFTGSGIEYLAEKHSTYGAVDVYLDGVFQKSIDLGLKNFPRLSQVVVFGAYDLPQGRHTIRIVNKAAACVVLDAFKVYGG